MTATACITIIDRQNHHLFQPLLYQVATGGLSAPEIAQPIRSILRNRPNLSVLLRDVTGFDLARREVWFDVLRPLAADDPLGTVKPKS